MRRRCSIHCKCWISVAQGLARYTLQELEKHRSQQALEKCTPSQTLVRQASVVGADPKKIYLCSILHGSIVLHWSAKTNLRLLQGIRHAITIHDHTSHDHRRCLCCVMHLSSMLRWSRRPCTSRRQSRSWWVAGRQNRIAALFSTWRNATKKKSHNTQTAACDECRCEVDTTLT